MFTKDVLVIDFESTGNDPWHDRPTQLGAILLDKGTLAEKDSFLSYIKADLTGVDPKILEISGITQEELNSAPSAVEVAHRFLDKFGYNVLLCSWNEYLDRRFLQNIMSEANLPYIDVGYTQGKYRYYDYHYLDLWPAVYVYLLSRGVKVGMRMRDIFKAFGMERSPVGHDALEDCRLEADILRKIVFGAKS